MRIQVFGFSGFVVPLPRDAAFELWRSRPFLTAVEDEPR